MQQKIYAIMQSKQVRQAADRLHLRKDKLWHIWFDSGLEYLEVLKNRIVRKRVFDAQFGVMLKNRAFGRLKPAEVFTIIGNSPAFWAWWSTQTWCICREGAFHDANELSYRLQTNQALIPNFILKKIFYVEQKHRIVAGSGQPGTAEAARTESEAGRIGNLAEHSFQHGPVPAVATGEQQH